MEDPLSNIENSNTNKTSKSLDLTHGPEVTKIIDRLASKFRLIKTDFIIFSFCRLDAFCRGSIRINQCWISFIIIYFMNKIRLFFRKGKLGVKKAIKKTCMIGFYTSTLWMQQLISPIGIIYMMSNHGRLEWETLTLDSSRKDFEKVSIYNIKTSYIELLPLNNHVGIYLINQTQTCQLAIFYDN